MTAETVSHDAPTIEPAVLDYASRTDAIGPLELRRALGWMLLTAILSGPCVGSCFLVLRADGEWGVALVHGAIYAATLGSAVIGGSAFARAAGASPRLIALDSIAGLGLVVIGLGPILYAAMWRGNLIMTSGRLDAVILALAFTALATSVGRHAIFYNRLAGALESVSGLPNSRRGLRALGGIKVVYEGIWLGSCAGALWLVTFEIGEGVATWLAFAALFGAFGYAILWLGMVLTHLTTFAKPSSASRGGITPARP